MVSLDSNEVPMKIAPTPTTGWGVRRSPIVNHYLTLHNNRDGSPRD